MNYVTVSADEQERLTFEVIGGLSVEQFEDALADDSILLDEEQLRAHLHILEQDHVRQSVRAKVSPPSDVPAGATPGFVPPATNPALVEDLERRIAAVKERLGLTK